MDILKVYHCPIDVSDLNLIINMLKENKVIFSPSIIPENLFNMALYLHAFESKENVCILIDRNLVSRVIKLIDGEVINPELSESKIWRLAAAVMVFALCGNIMIEPNISLYEFCSKFSNDDALKNLRSFRIADNIHPQIYADIALGRSFHIPKKLIKEVDKKIGIVDISIDNFSKELDIYNRQYLYVLKMVIIKRDSKLSETEKFITFMDWMLSEAAYNAIIINYAILFFSSRKSIRIVKNINSANPDKFRDGIKNLTWDITYLDLFKKKFKNENSSVWILSSNDKLLMTTSRMLFVADDGVFSIAKFNELLSANYCKDDASKLFNIFEEHKKIINNCSNRNEHLDRFFSNIKGLTAEYERILGIKS